MLTHAPDRNGAMARAMQGLKKPPVLLVDGYNLIGYLTTRKLFWQHQRKYGKRSISVHEVQMTDEQKEEAFSQVGRDKLLRRLSAYSGTKDVKVLHLPPLPSPPHPARLAQTLSGTHRWRAVRSGVATLAVALSP